MDQILGERTAIGFPVHAHAPIALGPDFPTAALHRYGALSVDNRAARAAACEPCSGGHILTIFLSLWERSDIGAALVRAAAPRSTRDTPQ